MATAFLVRRASATFLFQPHLHSYSTSPSTSPLSDSGFHALTTDTRVTATVITGFLSSGKTTLFNHILASQHGKQIAVIENEFGEVDIDGSLVPSHSSVAEDVVMVNNGCLCCTVQGDLVKMLLELVKKKGDKFDHIVIETTDSGFHALTTDTCVTATVITGFLSSGKTTLLNHILTSQHGKRIAVIENEFGEVDIDGSLVPSHSSVAEDVVMVNNGCLCCTVQGDLVEMLLELVKKKGDKFDHIVIQTTEHHKGHHHHHDHVHYSAVSSVSIVSKGLLDLDVVIAYFSSTEEAEDIKEMFKEIDTEDLKSQHAEPEIQMLMEAGTGQVYTTHRAEEDLLEPHLRPPPNPPKLILWEHFYPFLQKHKIFALILNFMMLPILFCSTCSTSTSNPSLPCLPVAWHTLLPGSLSRSMPP